MVALHEGILREMKSALRIDHPLEIRQAVPVKLGGQVKRLLVRLHRLGKRFAPDLFLGIRGQRVLGVFECNEDGLLVLVQRLFLLGVLDADVRPDPARLEEFHWTVGPTLQ